MMKLFQPNARQRRTMWALFAIVFVIAVLLTAFFQTQVIAGAQYATRSEENRLRPIPIPAPRGTIYDRNGNVVATSVPGYSVSLLPGREQVIEGTVRDLAPFLGLSERDIARILKQRNVRPHDLLMITGDATYSQVAAIEERRTSFPNLLISDRPKRYYPAGPAIAHLIGYVAEISERELQLPRFEAAGYEQRRWIGKAGIERQYELLLGPGGCPIRGGGRDGARGESACERGGRHAATGSGSEDHAGPGATAVYPQELRTTPERMIDYWRMSFVAGVQTGSIGVSGHIANGLAALFLACGQDVACVSEASVGTTRMECRDGNLYCALTLPNLIVGTVGGGTALPTARECLSIIDCVGDGKAGRLAEICAATALAGEISIVGALCANEFADAHRKLGRKQPS